MDWRSVAVRAVLGVVLGLSALMLSCSSFYTVAEQERAVLLHFGEAVRVTGPGLHFKIPVAQSVATVNVTTRTLTQGPALANTYTIDNQEIDAAFLIVFRVPEKDVLRIYREVPDYAAQLQKLAFDRFKREMGRVNVQDFAQHRGAVAQATLKTLQDDASRLYGLDVLDFQISDVTYTPGYRAAVEATAKAKQEVQKAEQEQLSTSIVAKTARIRAEGEASAVVATAEGKAKATRLEGEATAAAIRAQADALKQNRGLVELEKAKRWDGKLPVSVGLGSATPFMDIKSIRQAAEKEETQP